MARRRTQSPRKPIGISIHIGLNSVNPSHYDGWTGRLAACEFDAKDMKALAVARGFQPTVLLTKKAKAKAVTAAIADAATKLKGGDFLFVTYSGHGGQVPDTNGDESDGPTPDRWDETWVLYDREFVDDELYALWGQFEEGVRIFVLSDSCHSGSVIKARRLAQIRAHPKLAGPLAGKHRVPKMLPRDVQERTYRKHARMYDDIQKANPQGDRVAVGASVILISGCQDSQESLDGSRNGLFTETLRGVWNNGRFRGGYKRFHEAIAEKMPPEQTPNYMAAGAANRIFERQVPLML